MNEFGIPKNETKPKGNAKKYFAYKEAWSRINLSIKHGFYLEAVTIEESIISDKLITLVTTNSSIDIKKLNNITFFELIELARSIILESIVIDSWYDLLLSIDSWRIERNTIIHNIVKEGRRGNSDSIIDFILNAQKSAIKGKLLAKSLSKYLRENKKINEERKRKNNTAKDSIYNINEVK